MSVETIANLDDPRLRVFSAMTDAELKDPRQMLGLALAIDDAQDPERLACGLFVAESRNVIERALAGGYQPFCLFIEECWFEQSKTLVESL
ncbi:MAG: hypothetical protein IKV48_05075, partial [Eggerthellaceae bacterium]|nr:hypothetical protein [Eggerthellaceae bacterium]